MKKIVTRVLAAATLTGLAVGGGAVFVPATAEAHCGHGCGEADVYVETVCHLGDGDQTWKVYNHVLINMKYETQTNGKWDFTGCDPNADNGCVQYQYEEYEGVWCGI